MNRFNLVSVTALAPIGILFISLLACSGSDSTDSNPFLQPSSFSYVIDINLPLYNDLTFSNGAIYIPDGGINGFYVFNAGGTYMSWEASCPNHRPSSCSTLQRTGILVECDCEGYQYLLQNGLFFQDSGDGNASWPLFAYRVSKSGNLLTVSY